MYEENSKLQAKAFALFEHAFCSYKIPEELKYYKKEIEATVKAIEGFNGKKLDEAIEQWEDLGSYDVMITIPCRNQDYSDEEVYVEENMIIGAIHAACEAINFHEYAGNKRGVHWTSMISEHVSTNDLQYLRRELKN
jgi:hypothetical protein